MSVGWVVAHSSSLIRVSITYLSIAIASVDAFVPLSASFIFYRRPIAVLIARWSALMQVSAYKQARPLACQTTKHTF